MVQQDNASNKDTSVTDDLIEALVAISIVTKNLAKKVMMQSLKNDKPGGVNDESKRDV